MIHLNDGNGAGPIILSYVQRLAAEPPDRRPLVGAELGVAYGGGIEQSGRAWKPHGGTVHGFDTFSGHPKHLATSPDHHEAYCMDGWYGRFGTEGLTAAAIRAELDRQGLDNVVLHPGVIQRTSLDCVSHLHYALLDLDLIVSMTLGWTVVHPRLVSGGFLLLHDVIPRGHITGLWGLYQEIMAGGEYDVVEEVPRSYLAVLRRK